jgi:hypothetical protein
MSDTVTTSQEYGSIERFAEMIRDDDQLDNRATYIAFSGIARSVLGSPHSDTEKLAQIRNALAAADLVREELGAAVTAVLQAAGR